MNQKSRRGRRYMLSCGTLPQFLESKLSWPSPSAAVLESLEWLAGSRLRPLCRASSLGSDYLDGYEKTALLDDVWGTFLGTSISESVSNYARRVVNSVSGGCSAPFVQEQLLWLDGVVSMQIAEIEFPRDLKSGTAFRAWAYNGMESSGLFWTER